MSRPSPHNRPINSSASGWVSRLNENFSEILSEPFPMVLYADVAALSTAKDARLNKDCLALVGASGSARIYKSDGTNWEPYREQLANIPDLNPATATVSDVKDAFNLLVTDMVSKGWMNS